MITLTSLRKRLAFPKLSWQLCVLSMLGGAAAAAVVIFFNLAIITIGESFLTTSDDYTSLPPISRFHLPILGALVIFLIGRLTGYQYIRAGIPFVIHRLKVAYGVIPLKNTLNQFFGGIIALASGFSVGREGPVVHLGAACSSYIGNRLNLPNNSVRTLCASGIAAGIAACFNTPIAAVIFVMEVILREYEIHIFIPIMLAAIVGSMLTSFFLGPLHDYEFIGQISLTMQHYPALIALGIFLGMLSSGFNYYIVAIISKFKNHHIFTRLMIASLITGTLGYFFPHAMGTGSSAIAFLIEQPWHTQLLFSILAAKLVMTLLAIGLGVPGGIIGPIVSIGAIAGIFGAVMLGFFIPLDHLTNDFALMGMAGFMAATLNAPLAALLTVVELSNQLEIMLPAMIVIATSCLISGQLFNNRSVFTMQLDIQNLVYRKPPIEKSLQKVGVLAIMNSNFILCQQAQVNDKMLSENNIQNPLLIQRTVENSTCFYLPHTGKSGSKYQEHQLIPLSVQATLAEAYLALYKQRGGAVYVFDKNDEDIIGLITFEQIRQYLLEGKI
ncbi:MAG: chloride channel protein [Alteromonadaceae bacterium]|nr:chloride channel protein [Alteromonadaceae bacterium]